MRYSGGVYDIRKKCSSSFSGDMDQNHMGYSNVMTRILASSGQNELGKKFRKKIMLLINFCFIIHFDFKNTKLFSFSIGSKVMNPKMPLCHVHDSEADNILHHCTHKISVVLEMNLIRTCFTLWPFQHPKTYPQT